MANQPRTEAPAVGQEGILAGLGRVRRLQSAVSPADRLSWGWGSPVCVGCHSCEGASRAAVVKMDEGVSALGVLGGGREQPTVGFPCHPRHWT